MLEELYNLHSEYNSKMFSVLHILELTISIDLLTFQNCNRIFVYNRFQFYLL